MSIKKYILNKLFLNKVFRYDDTYQQGLRYKQNCCYPPGHYYSPIVLKDELLEREKEVFSSVPESIHGIELNVEAQKKLLKDFEKLYKNIPFKNELEDTHRFYLDNDYFSYTDAIILYSFIKKISPNKIIEIGSGFSSALMLDACINTKLIFIEPFPERLYSLISANDLSLCRIIEKPVQQVAKSEFEQLNENDILFIDSSHISKTGSDVNYIVFEILPVLKPGVLIHFHDIFYPFEYPVKWIIEGRNWNEDYLIKAFLINNKEYKIVLFNHYMHKQHSDVFKNMPECYKNFGSSLWLQKLYY